MIETDRTIISQLSEPINPAVDNLDLLTNRLKEELKNSATPGVGLAAIQIGVTKRVAIIKIDPNKPEFVLWNPEILERQESVVSPEGCLSLPGISRSVGRAQGVILRNGDGREYAFYGFEAIVVQHEIDHMDGLTIADKEYRALQVGRNEPCPCGARTPQGGIVKFKKCHLGKEQELQRLLIPGTLR